MNGEYLWLKEPHNFIMNEFCTVIDVLNKLESDNSRLFKLKVLGDNKDSRILKRVIKATLDPYTQYYIKKIPEYDEKEFIKDLDWALDMLDDLSSRKVTGNDAIKLLKSVL